jgi:hypothetical protein
MAGVRSKLACTTDPVQISRETIQTARFIVLIGSALMEPFQKVRHSTRCKIKRFDHSLNLNSVWSWQRSGRPPALIAGAWGKGIRQPIILQLPSVLSLK